MVTTERHIAEIQEAARCLADGRAHEAVDILKMLTDDFPGYVSAYVLLAKAYEANRQQDEALATWHTAHLLMPGSPLIARRRAARMSESLAPVSGEFVIPEDFFSAPPVAQEEPWDTEPDIILGSAKQPAEEQETPTPDIGWRIIDEIEDATDSMITAVEVTPDITSEPPNIPEETPELSTPFDDIGDIDDLIRSLENAPPIRPGNAEPDEPVEPDFPEVVSETLARIYETQKQYVFAARVYEKLAEELPHRSGEFLQKAAALRARSQES